MKNKILYQIGDGRGNYYVLNRTDLNHEVKTGFLSNLESSDFVDGEIRKGGVNRNRKQDYVLELDFIHREDIGISQDQLRVFFNSEVLKVFFYDMKNDEINNVYYTYCEAIQPLNDVYRTEDENGNDITRYSIELRFINPFYYLCDSNLQYIDINNVTPTLKLDQGLTLDSGLKLDSGESSTYQSFNGFTSEGKSDLLIKCFSDNQKALSIKDQYITKQTLYQTTSNVISQSLTNNDLVSQEVDLVKTTSDNKTYLVKISQMEKGDKITVKNSNGSDITITWLGSNQVNNLIFNSYSMEFYLELNGEIQPSNRVSFDFAGNLLYFRSKPTINPILTEKEALSLQKESTNNIDITINILPTFD